MPLRSFCDLVGRSRSTTEDARLGSASPLLITIEIASSHGAPCKQNRYGPRFDPWRRPALARRSLNDPDARPAAALAGRGTSSPQQTYVGPPRFSVDRAPAAPAVARCSCGAAFCSRGALRSFGTAAGDATRSV